MTIAGVPMSAEGKLLLVTTIDEVLLSEWILVTSMWGTGENKSLNVVLVSDTGYCVDD